MTSVAVISSAVKRIECLKELLIKQSESLPNEADKLLKGLQEMKEFATEAGANFVKLEKEIVRLSYEIVDAIADASFKSKEKFSALTKLTQRKKTGNTKLEELQAKLDDLGDKLKNIMQGEGSEQNPEPKTSRSSESSFVGKITGKLPNLWKKESTTALPPDSEIQGEKNPGPEIQEEEKEAGSENKGEEKDLLYQIRNDLLDPSKSSEVYIVGKGGMGKTTLARKLFHDDQIRKSFKVFGWVPVNQNYQIKGVLQLLLRQLGPQQQAVDIREMNEIELVGQIFHQLKNNKYLIVLDDIGTVNDWESIRLALPVANSSRIIITTSSNDFHDKAHHYKIPGLTQPQTITLLKEKASLKSVSEEVGKAIFDISGGSPLLATILGKSIEPDSSKKELVDELYSYHPYKGTPQVLGACYKRLAPELKPCLLYMSQFPQCQDIEVDKLYLLLMAENLISSMEPKISLQSFRDDDLDRLVDLKLVEVLEDMVATSGHYKFCRLHEQVREFCISKGLDEEFFEIVELGSSKKVGEHTRRLAIYLSKYQASNSIQFISQGTVKKILSLLIFDTSESAEEKSGWPPEINDLTELIHLRILNYDGVNFKFRKLPKGVDRLVLLRYLSFRGCRLEELPSAMSNLTQLETLDLLVHAECEMLIPINIFTNMKRMVHLYLPKLYRSNAKSKLMLHEMEMLEILVNFNTEICDVEALSRLKNLKILSTISEGQHPKDLNYVTKFLIEHQPKHSSVYIRRFECYNEDSVSALNELIHCKFVHSLQIEGQIVELPKQDQISCAENVAEIVLDGSQLEHNPMSYLGEFQNLCVLVLSNDAFLGRLMIISPAPLFPKLRSLKLLNLQYLEKLTIEKEAMPELSALQIDGCDALLELSIPKKLHDRLNKENGSDAYSVVPLPSKVKIPP